MPASDTGGAKPPTGPRALVETLELDGGSLGDGDLSALTLSHSSDRFTSSDLETLATIEAELHRLQTEDPLDTGSDELNTCETVEVTVTGHEVEVGGSPEMILPDMTEEGITEEMEVHDTAHEACNTIELATLPPPATFPSKVQCPSIMLIQSSTAASTPTHVTVSGGQIVGKFPGLSGNMSSMPQFQSLAQTLVTAKSAGGNVVQLRPAMGGKPIMATNVAGSLQAIKPLQASIKRPATTTTGPVRNVFAKVIIAGNQGQHQAGQPIMLATSQPEAFSGGQTLKIVSSTAGSSGVATKAITLAQAQQMGLLSPAKLQQILPSSPTKQSIIVNKLVTSPIKGSTKITMMSPPTAAKSPTKILPAPVTQFKPAVSGASSINATVKPLLSPQKVIIRQGLKPGMVLSSSGGTGQVIRIPATQNMVSTSGGIGQIQIPGTRQLQYVRLVSASSADNTTMTTTSKVRPANLVPVSTVSGIKPLPISALRGQHQTIKMVPIAPATPSVRAVVPKTTGQSGQRILIPASGAVTQLRATTTGSAGSAMGSGTPTILPSGTNSYVMVPAHLVQQMQTQQQQQQQQQQQLPTVLSTQSSSTQTSTSRSTATPEPQNQTRPSSTSRTVLEPNGIRPRKPCNCTKSQCLKLYCDCFANGEFCHMCNCNNCFNNLEHEEDRQRAIKTCLERNPNAFRPKIGKGVIGDERRHNKGCNCKRSGCLKNYCECYEAKIPCSNNCKCVGCRNVEENSEQNSLRELADAAEERVQQQTAVRSKLVAQIQDTALRPLASLHSGTRQPFNFMTQGVLDATCQCLLARAENAERNESSEEAAERFVIEEFGRCLVQIIQCSTKTEGNSVPL